MTIIHPQSDEYSLPPHLVPFAIRLANDGVPMMVLARAFKFPLEIVRSTLDDAFNAGSLVEIPRVDWPPTARRADRLPSDAPVQFSEEQLKTKAQTVFKSTAVQSALLAVLLKREEVSKETLHMAIEHQRMIRPQKPIDIEHETDMKMVDVVICHLRKKLKPFDLTITTIRGYGFFMAHSDRRKALELLQATMENPDA